MSAPVTVSAFPLILAGPVLRRVEPPREGTPARVTVWLALREPRRVTISVSDKSTALLRGEAETRMLGEHFHVVAVTADTSLTDDSLAPGTVYSYDLSFVEPSTGTSETLADALGGDTGVVAYPSRSEPTFSLPPSDPAQLRIVHSSCRKPHGEGKDALPAVDSMIQPAVSEANDRPHQLFLTGDQIYADDVADVLLAYIDELGPALLGRTETFGSGTDQKTIAEMPPGTRKSVVRNECGFSSDDTRSHLLGLAEYYAMYLLSWSDTVWPGELATPAELHPEAHATAMKYVNELGPSSFDEVRGWVEESGTIAEISWELHDAGRYRDQAEFLDAVDVLEAFTEKRDRVISFAGDVPAVRRALANVPTYMIFDDHEVTDDWYLNAEWCQRVVDSKLGRQVLQNGLIAYAVCQGWGNAPDRFGPGTKGGRVLDAATIEGSAPESELDITREDLDGLLGIPAVNGETLAWPSDPLDWHYPVRGTSDGTTTAHEVLVLDTRTRRGFVTGDEKAPPKILRADAVADQLPPTTTNPEVTVVVSAVPVWTVPLVDVLQDLLGGDEAEADKEHWRYQHDARERLLARLATRTPDEESGDPGRSRIVLLSGDVHHGFTARAQFWGTRPFESNGDDESEFVLASLTASGAKNEDWKTRLLHSLGYEGAWVLVSGLGVLMLVGNMTWLLFDDDAGFGVGETGSGLLSAYPVVKLLEGTPEEVNFGWNVEPSNARSVPNVVRHDPHLVHLEDDIDDVYDLGPAPAPDWRYRVDFLDAETYHEEDISHSVSDPTDIVVPPHGAPGPETRAKGLAAYREHLGTWASMTYNDDAGPSDRSGEYGFGSEIVGGNNVGEVAFEWGTEKRVIHALWWRNEGDSGPLPPFPLSKYVVSLEYEDEDHPRPEVVTRS